LRRLVSVASPNHRDARRNVAFRALISETPVPARGASLLQRASSRRAHAAAQRRQLQEDAMNGIIYLVGLVVVIMAILSFLGLR